MKAHDLTGRAFGRLTVIERVGARSSDGSIMWRCRCACGGEHEARATNLRSGRTRSCGCLNREVARERATARWQGFRALRARLERLEAIVESQAATIHDLGRVISTRTT